MSSDEDGVITVELNGRSCGQSNKTAKHNGTYNQSHLAFNGSLDPSSYHSAPQCCTCCQRGFVSEPTTRKNSCSSEWIELNVGGTIFKTTRLTLSKVPGSFLHHLAHEQPKMTSHADTAGAILIDRDPHYFSPCLNYLRCGKLILDKNMSEEGVLEEALFCGLTPLVDLLKERIALRDRTLGTGCSHVYRVLQCKEKELTQTVSTLTDGWKFEQLINSGSTYSYGEEDQAEFLCVVSKKKLDQRGDDLLDLQAQNWQNRQNALGRGPNNPRS